MAEALTFGLIYQPVRMQPYDTDKAALPYENTEAAFEQVFKAHFKALHAYAFSILKDGDTAEEIVQQVFYRLWEGAGRLSIQGSVSAYLYRAVYHESLNYLKHQKVKATHATHVRHHAAQHTENTAGGARLRELEEKLARALAELPEQCRTIFQMSRFEELRYREIAGKLGISVKTVENQMGKALRLLRLKLADFLPLLLFGLIGMGGML
ncbi:RNA polymerase sigma-70 factor [Compostibacter hankyongensis]|uniref:RNA polymerase sigma-70 factor n=1 Tax=Compostibacter hankyongensis TaxID=1007089 RepID=A0ABP8G5B5_9BACT